MTAIKVRENHCLVQANTLAIPAFAEAWTWVTDKEDLDNAVKLATEHDWPLLPLGSGSNVVLGDRLPGLVVSMEMRGVQVEERPGDKLRVKCAAGENWHELVTQCVGRGFYGLENLALIPGTVGAAPIQNIGAYGVELGEVFVSLQAMDLASGQMRRFSHEECGFRYRDSVFRNELSDRYVITEVCLELSRKPVPRVEYPSLATYLEEHSLEANPANIYAAVCQIRRERLPQPEEIPNAGSFFKNPIVDRATADRVLADYPAMPHWPQPDGGVKLPAAALIESQGWKGWMRRGVGIHERHALILVNPGHESGSTVLAFAAEIAESVYQAFGIELQIEPRCYPV